ncbi:TonB-dependent receptor [Shewanella glacialipiscicola]|uniref:TonB-dependent receptor plug domain-containing protein n=1 Tax=Shewanella glacialipiscicola TaxID=614069 RepID=UPI0021D89DAB|nr:TonB-dependent receptor [Shewanella glacialipiscicola]MCU7996263.1 TonB-dependent receptor [Shewanella glacialipiscicola]MCU8027576.1 TonB-dependent receptor [Shewanella glacialipiscicola]
MLKHNLLANSVRLALISGVAVAAFTAPVALAAEDGAKVERIEVTGSRIKRTDLEGAVPVTVIDREAIDLSGQTSVTDLLRNTTFNSAGSFRPQSGSSAQGTASLDLRGLGSSRTLVLVDGRRLTMSPSTGSSQDLNAIPLGAVERIEVLTDGASAIYGSDAIGGVVNIITRKDFNGVQLSYTEGQPSIPKEGGDRSAGSVLFGSSSDKTSLLGGVSWNKRDIVYARDYPWIAPGSSSYGNNWRLADEDISPNPLLAVPGGCKDDNFFTSGVACRYNFNATNANEASSDNQSLFLKGEYQINDDWKIFSNASAAKTESFGRYAPAPDASVIGANSYNNPTNPNAWFYDAKNPNAVAYDPTTSAQQDVEIWHRFAALGNRDTTVNNLNTDFLIGVNGIIGDSVETEAGFRRVRNKSDEIGSGYLSIPIGWGNVNDFNPGYGCESGVAGEGLSNCSTSLVFDKDQYRSGYDLQSPSSNPSDVLKGSGATTARVSEFNIDEFYINASFDMVEMPAGMIQAFVGAEYRKETYLDSYDAQSEAGNIGGSAGNSAGGDRDVKAAYFETLVPILDNLELSIAGRYDKYSDYGSDFSPKVSVRYEPIEAMVLRASYGKGFRAPTLDILTQKTAFSADSVDDLATCQYLGFVACPQEGVQVDAYRLANPELGSESSTQMSAGIAYQPFDWLNFAVDYYNIEIEDRIAFFSSQDLLDRAEAGDVIPPGLGVVRGGNGAINYINTGYGNEGTLETSGLDLNLRTNFDFGEAGSLNQTLQVSHILDYSIDGGRDNVKDPGTPQQRMSLSNVYNFSDFDFAWNINLIGDQYEDVVDGVQEGHVGSWVTHDIQVTYTSPWNSKISVGAENAFAKEPQLIGYDGREYNYNLYNGWGRIMYVRFSQSF